MSAELSKAYDAHSVEREVHEAWAKTRAFHAEPTDPGKPYSIVIPPPNVTAALHLGHALNNTLQDILVRVHRMRGENAIWFPGTDHAGIATQAVVEKRILAEEGKRRTEFKREDFVARIQAWKDEYETTILAQLKAMGCSCDYERTAFTMDEPRARAVREAFFRLFKDGLIYRGKRLVNWDPATQTALADDEVEMEEVDGFFYYLRYPLVDESGSEVASLRSEQPTTHDPQPTIYVTVATTRPETMLGDTAVGINPRDPRAAALRGKFVRLPIVNRIIPIIEDDYVVMPDPNCDDPKAKFATGFLKVTPAHDPNDYELGQRHNLKPINILAPDATISDKHGWTDVGGAEFLLGLDRYEAREAVVEWFRKNKLLEDVKPYRHSVGHSYRSHVAIEPYLSDQWYCKVTDPRLAPRAIAAIAHDQRSGSPLPSWEGTGEGDAPAAEKPPLPQVEGSKELRFYPSRYAKTFQSWHENIRDWCISRQLWWGHRIPVWRLPEGRLADRMSVKEFEAALAAIVKWESAGRIALRQRADAPETPFAHLADRSMPLTFVCVRDPADREVIHELERLGAQQDPDVLDTWFSSALWPMSTMGWPDDSAVSTQNSALNVWNPTSVLSTAREIITLWVSRMTMFGLYFLNRVPFLHVFIHAMVQDGEGRKMSKSLGNGVDPLDIISSHGCDAMRFTLATMATNTQDVRMPVERDAKTGKNTSPKFDFGRNFCNKLWNGARFVLMQLDEQARRHEGTEARSEPVDELKWSMADRWIVSRFNRTVQECNEALANYRFDQYAKACYDFFWRDFCDWYVEASKPAMKDPNRAAQTAHVLAATLEGSLRLMHPVIPFITEILWWKLCEVRPERGLPGRIMGCTSPLLIRAAWPRVGDFAQAAEHIWPRMQEIVTVVRNVRNESKVDPKKIVSVSINSPAESARQILGHRAEIEQLATCRLGDVGPDLSQPANSTKASAAGCEIFLQDLVDQRAEAQRSSKRRDELAKQIAAMKGRLGNAGYIAKAPAHLVKETQDQLAAAEAELAKLG
ncbi:MAG: valine--tRNA ligase [Tepidisphaeraceae bacterium]